MSVVTAVVFVSRYVPQKEEEALLQIDFGRGQHLIKLPFEMCGGNKGLESNVYVASVNSIDTTQFARIADLGLTGILTVSYQDCEIPEAYTFHDGKVARIQEPTFNV